MADAHPPNPGTMAEDLETDQTEPPALVDGILGTPQQIERLLGEREPWSQLAAAASERHGRDVTVADPADEDAIAEAHYWMVKATGPKPVGNRVTIHDLDVSPGIAKRYTRRHLVQDVLASRLLDESRNDHRSPNTVIGQGILAGLRDQIIDGSARLMVSVEHGARVELIES